MMKLTVERIEKNAHREQFLVCQILNPAEGDAQEYGAWQPSYIPAKKPFTLVSYEIAEILDSITTYPLAELLTSDVKLLREIGKRIQEGS